MLSKTESILLTQFNYWLDYYIINNFFYLMNYYCINLTYKNTIFFHYPTLFQQSLKKQHKRKLLNFLAPNFKNTQIYLLLNISNSFFIWKKPLPILESIFGLLTFNNYLIKHNLLALLNNIIIIYYKFMLTPIKSPLWLYFKN